MTYTANQFTYRKTLPLTVTVEQTDYQVMLIINRSSGTDTGFTVYVGTKCASDYSDIAFTDDHGNNCPYWIESSSSSTANVWVKLPVIHTSGTSLHFYYGGKVAMVSLSNGEKTFPFFDDFLGSSLGSGWTSSGSITVSGGSVTPGASGTNYIITQDLYGIGYSVIFKATITVDDSFTYMGFRNIANTKHVMLQNAHYLFVNGGQAGALSPTPSNGAHIWEITRNATQAKIYYDREATPRYTANDSDATTQAVCFYAYDNGQFSVDWVAVRKYASTEPAAGTWTAETTYTESLGITSTPIWQNGFAKRKALNVTSSAVLTGYQMPITINRSAGTDGTGVVYVGTTGCESDYRDIRFTDANGNALPYWIESSSSSTAYVWVKANAIATSGTVIYLYYGNASAVSQSSGDKVFEFFDDFNGSAIDSSKWNSPGAGSLAVSSSELTWSLGGATYDNSLASKASVSGDGYSIMSRCKYTTSYSTSGNNGVSIKINTNAKNHAVIYDTGNIVGFSETGVAAGTTIASSLSSGVYHILEGTSIGNILYGRMDHGNWYSWSRTALSGNFGLHMYNNTGSTRTSVYDWVAIRKYTATEPTFTPQTEETAPTYTPVYTKKWKVSQI